jgi:hypothetical protein
MSRTTSDIRIRSACLLVSDKLHRPPAAHHLVWGAKELPRPLSNPATDGMLPTVAPLWLPRHILYNTPETTSCRWPGVLVFRRR